MDLKSFSDAARDPVMSAFGLARLVVFIASLIPLARLFWLGMNDGLSANPVEFVTRSTGNLGASIPLSVTGNDASSETDGLDTMGRGLVAHARSLQFLHALLHFTL